MKRPIRGIDQLPLKADIKAEDMEDFFTGLIRKMVEKEVMERK